MTNRAAAGGTSTAGGGAVDVERWCGQCGQELVAGGHDACARRATLEPPRYCSRCARRMVVQVLPTAWTARCVAHGTTTGP